MRHLKLVALALCFMALLSSSCLAVQVIGSRTYTLDAHFDEGVLNRVTHDPDHDQLELIPPSGVDMGFIWVPNNDDTISRVDVETGDEIGRYRVGPEYWGASPSRTTVDMDGNCWVGCRGIGTVVKVGLSENSEGVGWIDRNDNDVCDTCVDANSDGKITGNEILPFGDDECVLFEVLLSDDQYRGTYAPNTCKDQWGYYHYCSSGPRGLAIDGSNNLWAGTNGTRKYFYIRGDNGQIEEVVDYTLQMPSGVNHYPYGAVMDANGVLWSSGQSGNTVMRLDPSTNPATCTFINMGHFVYGLGIDQNNHLYVSGWSDSRVSRINVLTGVKEWTRTGFNLYNARGVASTDDGDIWIAVSGTGYVMRLNNDCTVEKASIYVGGEPTGVAVDEDGYVWAVGNLDSNIRKIDPATNSVVMTVDLTDTYGHYGYSDMTGLVARTINTRKGTWTVVYDTTVTGASWGLLDWTSNEPAGTDIKVRVCSSDDPASGWSNWENVTKNVTLTQTPDGRYLKIEATLETTTDGITPILYDLTASYVNALIVAPSTLAVPEGGQNTFQVKLKAAPTASVQVYTARIAGDYDLYVSAGSPLTFTTVNWDTWQTVTIGALEDPDLANGSATFRASCSALRGRDVLATEVDNDSLPYSGKWGLYGSGAGQFDHPMDVCSDAEGYIYVADTQNHRVQKFTPTGQFVGQWGSYGTGNGQFDQPCGICVGIDGHIFVADTFNNRIQEFTSDGTYVDQISYYLTAPWGVASDAEGNLYIASTYGHQVYKFSLYDDGYGYRYWSYTNSWGSMGTGDQNFQYPEGLTVDNLGYLYVADTYNHRVQMLCDGVFTGRWGSYGTAAGQFRYPKGICFDPTYSNLFVSDTYNHRIQSFADGSFQSQWGSYGSGDGQFACPGGVACDPVGNLYVADTENNRIQRFGWAVGDYHVVPDGTPVQFGPVSVTAVFPTEGWIYVESLDRVSGIRVHTSETFTVGQVVDVKGVINTDSSYLERYVQADAGYPIYVGTTNELDPLGMRNEWIVETSTSYAAIPTQGLPYYSTGLLVNTWGRVVMLDPTNNSFLINDGSAEIMMEKGDVEVGKLTRIRVFLPDGATMPALDDFVVVTGINGKWLGGNRAIRPRTTSDLTTVTSWTYECVSGLVPGWNYLSLPGIPRFSAAESVWYGCPGGPGIPLEGNLQRYYAPGQFWFSYLYCPITPVDGLIGEGYGLYISTGGASSYKYYRTPVTGDQVISLPTGSVPAGNFSLIGNPFDADRAWSCISVADGRESKTLAAAVSAGWIYQIQKWTGTTWQTVDISTESMQARKAYKVFPARHHLALIVPEP